MKHKGIVLPCLFLLTFQSTLQVFNAQEPQKIIVKKETNLLKAVFDNTEFKLMVVDRFGNPTDNKIVKFRLYVKANNETKEFSGYSNELNNEIKRYLNTLKKASKIFFTEITAEDENAHLVKLPDIIETWFPNCSNCEPSKKYR